MVEVNGQQYQHATSSFKIVVGGAAGVPLPLKTIKKVDFSVDVTKELTNDSQGQVDGFVVKPSKHEGSISLKLSEWFVIRAALNSNAVGGVLLCQFNFSMSYGNGFNALHSVALNGCMVQKEAYSSEDSQDPDMMEMPLIFAQCLVDGQPPVRYEPI